jgi:hypothetical protein
MACSPWGVLRRLRGRVVFSKQRANRFPGGTATFFENPPDPVLQTDTAVPVRLFCFGTLDKVTWRR